MATIGTSVTYLDILSLMGADNKISAPLELMTRTNEMLQDFAMVKCNSGPAHQTTIRTGLPTVTWRMLNYGVQPSKSTSTKIQDTCGMLEAYAQVDKSLADLNNNSAAWRLSEDRAFLEAMNQEMATSFFYGNQNTDPQKITGLTPRYPAYGDGVDYTETNFNCIDAYAATASGADQTSIWLVVWGDQTVHGIYPDGSQSGGFYSEDKGQVTLDDDQTPTGHYEGYRTHYKWDIGLTVRDWRYVVRICNIDTSALIASNTAVDLYVAMIKAYYRIPNFAMGRAVFYCNRFVAEFLHLQAIQKSVLALKVTELDGVPITSFLGIPIRRSDALLITEAVVTAA